MFSPRQWLILGAFVFYSLGVWHMSSVYTNYNNDQDKIEAVEKEIKNTKAEKEKADRFYKAFMVEKQKNATTQRTIENEVAREVENPIYNGCVIPDSGMLLIEQAIKHSNSRLSTD